MESTDPRTEDLTAQVKALQEQLAALQTRSNRQHLGSATAEHNSLLLPSPSALPFWRRKFVLSIVGLLVLGGLAVLGVRHVYDARSRNSAPHSSIGASTSPLAGVGPGAGWGVHVCKERDYDFTNQVCLKNTPRFTLLDLDTSHLEVTGLNGAKFSGGDIVLRLTGTDGGMLGSDQPVHVSLTTNEVVIDLKALIESYFGSDYISLYNLASDSSDANPMPFIVHAVEDGTNLGSITFNLVGVGT